MDEPLRDWPAERVERLLRARPDLAVPPPQDLSELRRRARSHAGLRAAVRDLPTAPRLVLDALALLPGATVEALIRLSSPAPPRAALAAAVEELETRLLLEPGARTVGDDVGRAQADGTLVCTGTLSARLRADLDARAAVESRGTATVRRLTEPSLVKAYAAGWTAVQARAALERWAGDPPQAMTYLVDDAARRAERLRTGSASAAPRLGRPRAGGRAPTVAGPRCRRSPDSRGAAGAVRAPGPMTAHALFRPDD